MEAKYGYFARALRAIGQDLADLLPDSLTIQPDGADFVVHGMCNRSRLETRQSESSWSGLRKLSARLRARILKPPMGEPNLDLAPFTQGYNAADIDRLDRRGNRRRFDVGGLPEIYSLGERLRTIGKVIDSGDGELVRIHKDLHHIVCEFRDGDAKLRKIELDNTQLYRLQRSYASERNDSMQMEPSQDNSTLAKSN